MASAAQFVAPYFQFMDPTGLPYAGATIAFYASGTNTPQATYADDGLTIANANPVVANSSGTFPSIYLQDLPYRAVLSDQYGNQIWTADPIALGGNFTETVVVEGTGAIGFEAINSSADGQTWSWLSNPDGSFSALNGNTGNAAFSINSAGSATFPFNPQVTSATTAAVSMVSTAGAGGNWAVQSNPDGSFSVYNYTSAIAALSFTSGGLGTAHYGWTFDSTVQVNGATTFSGAVNIESALTLTDAVTFEAGATFEAAASFNGTAAFTQGVSFTVTPYVTSATSVGFEMINTSSSGRNWGMLSDASGHLEFYDYTAAELRGYFDANGALYLLGGPNSGTISGATGLLTTAGASTTTTGTYNFGLSVTNGVTALAYSATSDARAKTNIVEIEADDAWNYVMAARPVTFDMGESPGMAGFIAQDEIKTGRGASVGMTLDESMAAITDEDGFESPAGVRFIKVYDHDIAYLTRALQDLRARFDIQAETISMLEGLLP